MNSKPNHILFGFWHGIGDLILSTPSFRRYKALHPGTKMSIAVIRQVIDSGFLDHCPYFENVLEVSSAWDTGTEPIEASLKQYQALYEFDEIKLVHQAPYYKYGIHKIERTAREMGVYPLRDIQTEVFLDPENERAALNWLKDHHLKPGNYLFLNRKTGFPQKDLPQEIADAFIQKNFPNLPIVEPGVSYPLQHINFTFELLKKASKIMVVDSSMMHAADALKKPIDFAYFAIRPGIVDEVKPRNVICHCVESDAIKKWPLKLRKKAGMKARWLLNQCLPH